MWSGPTNHISIQMKMTIVSWIDLGDMIRTLVCQTLRNESECKWVVEGVGRVHELTHADQLELLLIDAVPIFSEPVLQHQGFNQVLLCESESVPGLLDGNGIAGNIEGLVETAKPKIDAGDGVLLEGDLLAVSFEELAAEHDLQWLGLAAVDNGLTGNLKGGSLEDGVFAFAITGCGIVLDDLDGKIATWIDVMRRVVLWKVSS